MVRSIRDEVKLLKKAIQKGEDCYLFRFDTVWRLITIKEFMHLKKLYPNEFGIKDMFMVYRASALNRPKDTDLVAFIQAARHDALYYHDEYIRSITATYEQMTKD